MDGGMKDGLMDEKWINGQLNGGLMDERWMHGWWMDWWMKDGSVDGWMDGLFFPQLLLTNMTVRQWPHYPVSVGTFLPTDQPNPHIHLHHLTHSSSSYSHPSFSRKRQTEMEEDIDQSKPSPSIALFPLLLGCSVTLPGLRWFLLTCSCMCVWACECVKFTGKNLEWVTRRSGSTREQKKNKKKHRKWGAAVDVGQPNDRKLRVWNI